MSQTSPIEETKTLNFPEPFLGRIVIKVIKEDVDSYLRKLYGMENSLLVLPETTEEKKRVPFKKGIILKLACDAFGEAFKARFGEDFAKLKEGDTIWFIPNQTYKLDVDDTYHIVGDEDIIAFERGNV